MPSRQPRGRAERRRGSCVPEPPSPLRSPGRPGSSAHPPEAFSDPRPRHCGPSMGTSQLCSRVCPAGPSVCAPSPVPVAAPGAWGVITRPIPGACMCTAWLWGSAGPGRCVLLPPLPRPPPPYLSSSSWSSSSSSSSSLLLLTSLILLLPAGPACLELSLWGPDRMAESGGVAGRAGN